MKNNTSKSISFCLIFCVFLTQCKKEDPNIRNCRVIDGGTGKGIPNARWFLLNGGSFYNPDNPSGYTNECGEFTCDRSGYQSVKADKEGYHDYYEGDVGLYISSDIEVKLYAKAEILVRVHNDPQMNDYDQIRLWGLYSGSENGLIEHDSSMSQDGVSYAEHEVGNRNLHLWGEYINGTDTTILTHNFWVEPFVFNEFAINY
jgi:hypothetical protein